MLKNIGANRDDVYEIANAGMPFDEIDAQRIPCLAERGTFLSPRAHHVLKEHPYRFNPGLRGAIQPTTVTIPAYSVHATPYFWLNRANTNAVERDFDVDFRPELEEVVDHTLGFEPTWIIHGDNQQALIERFFADVSPGSSLVFFYAKHSPFEGGEGRRLLVGAARISGVELPGRWHTTGRAPFPNHMWETIVRHSLRPGCVDGILLPVAELAKLDAEGLDVSPALAWSPRNGDRDFSYVTEQVSDDTAISALDRLFQAAQRCADYGLDVPGAGLEWAAHRMGELWTSRGPAPGLGTVMTVLDVKHGPVAARKVVEATPEGVDPWKTLVGLMESARHPTPPGVAISPTTRAVWKTLTTSRRRALELLSRFQLSVDQARGILAFDHVEDLLDNPYLATTSLLEPPSRVPFDVVDRGCFPPASSKSRSAPVPPTPMTDGLDARRVEALITDVLTDALGEGDTVVPLDRVLAAIGERSLTEPCPVTEDVLRAHDLAPDQLGYDPEVWTAAIGTTLANGLPAFKLFDTHGNTVFVRKRLEHQRRSARLAVPDDVEALVDAALGGPHNGDDADSGAETRARIEKAAALTEMLAAPLSVLDGRAGTGKTTLIKALVGYTRTQRKNVLLLAPTGKARVQLQQKVKHEAKTLAQFLAKHGRYDDRAGYQVASDRPKAPHYHTVVVDECSMLTEGQLAALLDSLHPPQRLVLVGDPRQLPPIGEGRPFVDLIAFLKGDAAPVFPNVTEGYAELTVLRRQTGHTLDDLQLAAWFSGDEIPVGYEEVWERLRTGEAMLTLAALPWRGRRVEEVIDDALTTHLDITGPDAFDLSYGGQRNGQWVGFQVGSAAMSEKWQILSPTRGHAWGTVQINRQLKRTYRARALDRARANPTRRTIPEPIGVEQIVFGDKVLNNRNRPMKAYPPEGALSYVANGEIGVVVGRAGKAGTRPRWTDVEFSSQSGVTYRFAGDDEEDPTLELAWATTVHKSQGSEFGDVLVVLPSFSRRLSRELLYTALTRQTGKVVLLHERPVDDLLDLTSATGSETARRLTDLFTAPDPRPVLRRDGTPAGVYDANLIHISASGVLMRSKNEVIVSRILDDVAPDRWHYEQPLEIDGSTRWPDFTIVTADGRTVYWEHLGMLGDPDYERNWERKVRWYAKGGVLPHEEGGGPDGVLMWTDDRDGVDVPAWTNLAQAIFGPTEAVPAAPSHKKIRRLRGHGG